MDCAFGCLERVSEEVVDWAGREVLWSRAVKVDWTDERREDVIFVDRGLNGWGIVIAFVVRETEVVRETTEVKRVSQRSSWGVRFFSGSFEFFFGREEFVDGVGG